MPPRRRLPWVASVAGGPLAADACRLATVWAPSSGHRGPAARLKADRGRSRGADEGVATGSRGAEPDRRERAAEGRIRGPVKKVKRRG